MGVPNTTFKRKPANEKSSHKTLWRAQPRNKISFLRGGYFPVGCKLPGFISMIKALGNHAQSFQPQESEGKNRKTSLIFSPPQAATPPTCHTRGLYFCFTFSIHGSGAQPARICGLSYPAAPKALAATPGRGHCLLWSHQLKMSIGFYDHFYNY